MQLPQPQPSELLEQVPLLPIIEDYRRMKALDRALLDKAVTIEIAKRLPGLTDNALRLAEQSDSDSVQADMTKYLIDRAAGKPMERSQSLSVNLNLKVSPENVQSRLSHLLNNSYYEATQESDGVQRRVPEEGGEGTTEF
jgi:hypothetical protein